MLSISTIKIIDCFLFSQGPPGLQGDRGEPGLDGAPVGILVAGLLRLFKYQVKSRRQFCFGVFFPSKLSMNLF